MESGPAIFAGLVFCLFGAALLVWTATRARQHRPVVHGAGPLASVTVAAAVALVCLALGAWCLTRL
ncbi:hypothetical protein [Streptomyces sp. enrichment culture]|uniref:hypothetical protein n=1 Tax=Streptomyces sp. enrichment culture TaxID=1795815 RepID=UPI003F54456B